MTKTFVKFIAKADLDSSNPNNFSKDKLLLHFNVILYIVLVIFYEYYKILLKNLSINKQSYLKRKAHQKGIVIFNSIQRSKLSNQKIWSCKSVEIFIF